MDGNIIVEKATRKSKRKKRQRHQEQLFHGSPPYHRLQGLFGGVKYPRCLMKNVTEK